MDNVKKTIAELFEEMAQGLASGSYGAKARVGLTLTGSEHGEAEMLRGAELAQQADPSIEVVVIGQKTETALRLVEADSLEAAHAIMDKMLLSGELHAAVTMHYSFPIGVSTVGRVTTPGLGRRMYVANTTGTSDTDRVSALIKNTVGAIAVAKACGNPSPTVGILNIDGARQLERALLKLRDNGYPIRFTSSARADGGVVMRGNDLLQGVPDIMVMDSLTGNVIIKVMSAYTTGGSYESLGDAYGPAWAAATTGSSHHLPRLRRARRRRRAPVRGRLRPRQADVPGGGGICPGRQGGLARHPGRTGGSGQKARRSGGGSGCTPRKSRHRGDHRHRDPGAGGRHARRVEGGGLRHFRHGLHRPRAARRPGRRGSRPRRAQGGKISVRIRIRPQGSALQPAGDTSPDPSSSARMRHFVIFCSRLPANFAAPGPGMLPKEGTDTIFSWGFGGRGPGG